MPDLTSNTGGGGKTPLPRGLRQFSVVKRTLMSYLAVKGDSSGLGITLIALVFRGVLFYSQGNFHQASIEFAEFFQRLPQAAITENQYLFYRLWPFIYDIGNRLRNRYVRSDLGSWFDYFDEIADYDEEYESLVADGVSSNFSFDSETLVNIAALIASTNEPLIMEAMGELGHLVEAVPLNVLAVDEDALAQLRVEAPRMLRVVAFIYDAFQENPYEALLALNVLDGVMIQILNVNRFYNIFAPGQFQLIERYMRGLNFLEDQALNQQVEEEDPDADPDPDADGDRDDVGDAVNDADEPCDDCP